MIGLFFVSPRWWAQSLNGFCNILATADTRLTAAHLCNSLPLKVKSNGNGGKGGRQATAMMAMEAATTVVGKDEGNGGGDEGGGQQKG